MTTISKVVKETSVWGNYRTAAGRDYLRVHNKRDILQNAYPFVDHYRTYVLKPTGQKGPARESQTFLVSYAYFYDHYSGITEDEGKFIERCTNAGLTFYKEPCMYGIHKAYKIFIMDSEVNLQDIIHFSPDHRKK